MISVNEIFLILFIPVFVFVIAFWLWMLIDCLKRPDDMFKKGGNNSRLIWTLVIIFIGIIGALIYFFRVKRTDSYQDKLISIALLISLVMLIFFMASQYLVTTRTTVSIEPYPPGKLSQSTPPVTMNGTFQIVTIPACPFNTQCDPKYELTNNNGTYQLLFGSVTGLPNNGQYIEVKGIVTYTEFDCRLNEKEVPCQPVGRVNVLSWNNIKEK